MMKPNNSTHILFFIGTVILSVGVMLSIIFQKQRRNPLAYTILEIGNEPESNNAALWMLESVSFKTAPMMQWAALQRAGSNNKTGNPFFSQSLDQKLNPPPPPPPPPKEEKKEEPKPKPPPPPPPRKVELYFNGIVIGEGGEQVAWVRIDQQKILKLKANEKISDIPYQIQSIHRDELNLSPLRSDLKKVILRFNQSLNIEIPVDQP